MRFLLELVAASPLPPPRPAPLILTPTAPPTPSAPNNIAPSGPVGKFCRRYDIVPPVGSQQQPEPETLTGKGIVDLNNEGDTSDSDDDYDDFSEPYQTYEEYDYDASDDDYVYSDSESSNTIQSEKLMELDFKSVELPSEEMARGGKKEEDLQVAPQRPQRIKGRCRWAKPFQGVSRVDTDGSVKKGKAGGYGAIIRNSDGQFVAAASGVSEHKSVLLNQLLGVKLGLELAFENKCDHPEVNVNSRFVYLLVTFRRHPYDDEDYETAMEILEDIVGLAKRFRIAGFHLTNRKSNQAADYLSKLFAEVRFEMMSDIQPEYHQKLIDIIGTDAAGEFYDCML